MLAKGSMLFHGITIAHSKVKGTDTMAAAQISVLPSRMGMSRPMSTSRPAECLRMKSWHASEMGVSARPNTSVAMGSSVIAHAAENPSTSACATV